MRKTILVFGTIVLVIVFGLYINLVDKVNPIIVLPMLGALLTVWIYTDAFIQSELPSEDEEEEVSDICEKSIK